MASSNSSVLYLDFTLVMHSSCPQPESCVHLEQLGLHDLPASTPLSDDNFPLL